MINCLAKQLGLKQENKELLPVAIFGAAKVMNMNTYVVKFNVKLEDILVMLLFANVLKQITGNILHGPLNQNDIEFVKLISSGKLDDSVIPR